MRNFKERFKNNRGGGDLQFLATCFLFIFMVALSLLLDFWYVSSAKISIIKEVQGAELFRLVTSIKEGGGLDDPIFSESDPTKVDLGSYQRVAVNGMRNELVNRLDNLTFLKNYEIQTIEGLSQPIGEMGIRTIMTYQVKTMIRTPGQIFNIMLKDDEELELTSADSVQLKVMTKLVPYIHEN